MRTKHAAHDSELPQEETRERDPRDGRQSPWTEQPEDATQMLVILPLQDITLPEVLRHIEAGRIVLIISAPNAPR
jgi:hypothetical protein